MYFGVFLKDAGTMHSILPQLQFKLIGITTVFFLAHMTVTSLAQCHINIFNPFIYTQTLPGYDIHCCRSTVQQSQCFIQTCTLYKQVCTIYCSLWENHLVPVYQNAEKFKPWSFQLTIFETANMHLPANCQIYHYTNVIHKIVVLIHSSVSPVIITALV